MIDALRENRVRSDKCIGEVHISLFDLEQQQLLLQSSTGNAELIDLSNTAQSPLNLFLADDLSYVDLLYDLTGPVFDPLGRLSGDRELIFSLGGEEALATIEAGGSVRFNNPANINLFDDGDFLTIQFYQANDTANILWEYAFGGIEITSSSDKDSNKVQSFIICDAVARQQNICTAQLPITAKLLLPVQETDSVQWRVEALEGSDKTDDMPGETNGGSGPGNKPFAYGKTKNWRTGGLSASAIAPTEFGNGRYQNAWISQPQFGTEAVYFSFVPDMRDATGEQEEFKVEHLPAVYQRKRIGGSLNPLYTCSGQYDNCINGTNMSDVWRHNPHVGYKISVIINGKHTITKTVKMDEIDVLRQEYINHRAGNTNITYSIPDRSDFARVDSNSNYQDLVEGPCNGALNCVDYPYEYILDRTTLKMWDSYKVNFNSMKNNVFKGVGGADVSIAGDWSVKLNSTYRNPERNERVASTPNSKHQLGGAFDMGIKGFNAVIPSAEADYLLKARSAYIAWKILTNSRPAGATMIQMEPSPSGPLIRVSEAVIAPATNPWEPRYLNGGNRKTKDYMTTRDREPTLGDGIPDGFKNLNHFHIQDDKVK